MNPFFLLQNLQYALYCSDLFQATAFKIWPNPTRLHFQEIRSYLPLKFGCDRIWNVVMNVVDTM